MTTTQTPQEPHRYVSEGVGRWRTCAICGRGANAGIHKAQEPPTHAIIKSACGCWTDHDRKLVHKCRRHPHLDNVPFGYAWERAGR